MPKYLDFFAREMRTRRKEAGLSQEALAEKTEVSIALISEIERGIANPTIQTLEKIASFFNATLPEMLSPEHESESTAQLRLRLTNRIMDMNTIQLESLSKFIAKL